MTTRILRAALVCALAAAPAACGGATSNADSSDSDQTSIRLGFSDFSRSWHDDKGSSVAVANGKAYVGLGDRGLAVVDLAKMKTEQTVRRDSANQLLPAETVRMSGGDVVVGGLRDVAPLDPFRGGADYVYVATFLDPNTLATKKQIFVAVQKAISNPNDPLFDIPNTSFAVDGSSLYLMVAHRRLHAIARIEIPAGKELRTTAEEAFGAHKIEIAEAAHDVTFDGGSLYVSEVVGRGGVVKRIDPASGRSAEVARVSGYPVGAAIADGRLFVADHEQALHVVDVASGRELSRTEVPDWVTGVTVDHGLAFTVTWTGIFVAKSR